MSTNFKDLNNLEDTFGKLADKAEAELDSLTADKVFTQDFMQRHTDCSDFNSFLSKGGISADINTLNPTPMLNEYISKSSSFSSWEEMCNAAMNEYLQKFFTI